ncbi:MAG: VOC family protein [Desulfobacteraceae bacterium]|nr:VOC family protein [Desulfobacteraceae bacterium]
MDEFIKKHGVISWTELTTSDVDAAKKFYSEIFGWEYEDMDSGGMPYTIAKAHGKEIAGMMITPEEADGCPPVWGSYVSVDNVDETAKKVEALGGKVHVAPRDIPNVGRFTVFQDPQGAFITAITMI